MNPITQRQVRACMRTMPAEWSSQDKAGLMFRTKESTCLNAGKDRRSSATATLVQSTFCSRFAVSLYNDD